MQANFLVHLGDEAHVPIISFSATSLSLSSLRSPYFFRAALNDSSQIQPITAIIQAFGWKEVVPIYIENEYGEGLIPFLTDTFQESEIRVPYRSTIHPAASDEEILVELYKLMTMQTRVFIVHMTRSLSARLFTKANEIGMMSEGYVWSITDGITNSLNFFDPLIIIDSMQGVIGVKPYVLKSEKLEDFTSRWKDRSHQEKTSSDLNVFGLWAYDAATALAMAVEKVGTLNLSISNLAKNSTTDFESVGVSQNGIHLCQALSSTRRFRGLSGNFSFVDGQLQSSAFEIVNVIGNRPRGIGFWTLEHGIVREFKFDAVNTRYKDYSTSQANLKAIIWPGDTTCTPKGWVVPTNGKVLRVAVPVKNFYSYFVRVTRDAITNRTSVTGYCIDVFDAVMAALPYSVPYEFIPFEKPYGERAGYDILVHQVFLGLWVYVYFPTLAPEMEVAGPPTTPYSLMFDGEHLPRPRETLFSLRQYFDTVRATEITWQPWAVFGDDLENQYSGGSTSSQYRFLLEGPVGRAWFLGERFQRQIWGGNSQDPPAVPPDTMRTADRLSLEEVEQYMQGSDALLHLIEGNYATYRRIYLMPPLTGVRAPPLRPTGAPSSSRARTADIPSSSRAGSSRGRGSSIPPIPPTLDHPGWPDMPTELTNWRFGTPYQIPLEPPLPDHRYVSDPDSPPPPVEYTDELLGMLATFEGMILRRETQMSVVGVQKFDAVVGDITIRANRSKYVDFTFPYTESGVTMIVPFKDNKYYKNAWVFLKPLTWDLWVTSTCFFVFIGFVIWILEHQINEDFNGPPLRQISTSVWFSFSTMIFSHKEKVVSNLARFVVIIWCFVVLILTQSYTASLTSLLTIHQLEPSITDVRELINKGESVGYPKVSFIYDILKQMNFSDSQLKGYNTVEGDLDVAFSNQSIAAAFDEIPYLKLFTGRHCSKYTMVAPTHKTGGFGFAFRKGSHLVVDVSAAILNVIEGDKMSEIENKWFGQNNSCADQSSSMVSSSSLSVGSFWGLFLVVGIASSFALIIFTAMLAYEHRSFLVHLDLKALWRKYILQHEDTVTGTGTDTDQDQASLSSIAPSPPTQCSPPTQSFVSGDKTFI